MQAWACADPDKTYDGMPTAQNALTTWQAMLLLIINDADKERLVSCLGSVHRQNGGSDTCAAVDRGLGWVRGGAATSGGMGGRGGTKLGAGVAYPQGLPVAAAELIDILRLLHHGCG